MFKSSLCVWCFCCWSVYGVCPASESDDHGGRSCIMLGVNLPLSVALVWISNPITMPVLFYFAYKLGALVMHVPPQPFHFELSWEFIMQQMNTIGPPFLLGCAICGVVSAIIGYFGIRGLWRYSVVRSWQKRKVR